MQSQCKDCPKGHFCVEASVHPVACPVGSYGDVLNLETPYVSSLPTDAACRECPAGYKCEEGAIEPVECGLGYYSGKNEGVC